MKHSAVYGAKTMERRNSITNAKPFHALLFLSFTATLTGCITWHIPDHGFAAKDYPPLSAGPALMPPTAPSIPQGFEPLIEVEQGIYIAGHEGIDIAADKHTPVLAAASGRIIAAKWEPMYGHQMVIWHPVRFEGRRVKTRYLHLSKRLLEVGDSVSQGQPIGRLGSTGVLAGYPHLHFEVRLADSETDLMDTPVNPHRYWPDGPGKVSCFNDKITTTPTGFFITYPVPC